MTEKCIPNLEGELVARRLYMSNEPHAAPKQLQDLGQRLRRHYREIGMWNHDPQRAHRMILKGMWRAVSAPIIYGIERELTDIVTWRQEQGLSLAAPDIPEHINVDRIYANYGKYQGRHYDFLRSMGKLSYLAARNFLSKALNEDGHWAGPLYTSFQTIDSKLKLEPLPRVIPLQSSFRMRFLANVIAANVTLLGTLVPAAHHLSPELNTGEALTQKMLRRADELSRPQYVTADFFDRHFPSDMSLPKICPFEHDADQIAVDGIWNAAALKRRSQISRWCPASIPFGSTYTTAADLRLKTGILAAGETLWAPSMAETELQPLLTSVSSV